VLEAKIAELRAEFESQEEQLGLAISQQKAREAQFVEDRAVMGKSRKADIKRD
jgi:hypothetical protein